MQHLIRGMPNILEQGLDKGFRRPAFSTAGGQSAHALGKDFCDGWNWASHSNRTVAYAAVTENALFRAGRLECLWIYKTHGTCLDACAARDAGTPIQQRWSEGCFPIRSVGKLAGDT